MQTTVGFSFRISENEAKKIRSSADNKKWSAALWIKEAIREKLEREEKKNEAT